MVSYSKTQTEAEYENDINLYVDLNLKPDPKV